MVVRLFVDVPPGAPESLQAADREENEASAAPSSASIDQCEEISRHLGLALEVEDAMPSAYVLEVSTPGSRAFFSALTRCAPIWATWWKPAACSRGPGSSRGDGHGPPPPLARQARRRRSGRLCSGTRRAFSRRGGQPRGSAARASALDSCAPASRMYIFRQPVKPGKGPGKGSGKGSRKTPGKSAGPVPAHGEASPEAK